jgi:hypothetical protein
MRHVINCIRLWNLGSASGVTRRILNVRGQYGLDIVKRWSSCVTDLNSFLRAFTCGIWAVPPA